MRAAADDGPAEVTSIYLEKTIYMFRLIQPAAMVAVEMGIDEIKTQLGAALQEDADGLIEVLATTTPQLPAETRHDLPAAIRRTLLALSLDPNATENDVRIQLTAVISGFVAVGAPTPG